MTWQELSTRFVTTIADTYATTLGKHADAIARSPDAFRARVAGFLDALAQARANLARIAAHIPNPPRTPADAQLTARYAEMKSLYDALVVGLARNAVPAKPEIGWGPAAVILVVGAVGLTLAGIAWAVAAYEYAVGLRDQTGFLARELDARVEAMRAGTTLQPATATPPSAPSTSEKSEGGAGWAWLIAGLGLAAGAVFVVPKLGKG